MGIVKIVLVDSGEQIKSLLYLLLVQLLASSAQSNFTCYRAESFFYYYYNEEKIFRLRLLTVHHQMENSLSHFHLPATLSSEKEEEKLP